MKKGLIITLLVFLGLISNASAAFKKGDVIASLIYDSNGKISEMGGYFLKYYLSDIFSTDLEFASHNTYGLGLEYILDANENSDLTIGFDYNDFQVVDSYTARAGILGFNLINVVNEPVDLKIRRIPVFLKCRFYISNGIFVGGRVNYNFIDTRGYWDDIQKTPNTIDFGMIGGCNFADDWLLEGTVGVNKYLFVTRENASATLYQGMLELRLGKKL